MSKTNCTFDVDKLVDNLLKYVKDKMIEDEYSKWLSVEENASKTNKEKETKYNEICCEIEDKISNIKSKERN